MGPDPVVQSVGGATPEPAAEGGAASPACAGGEATRTPAPEAKSSRRKALKVAAVVVAGGAVGVGVPAGMNVVARWQKPAKWRSLSDAEVAVLEPVCEQIVPADQDPGARETNCVVFIDRQLGGHYQRFRDAYKAGLAALQATCQAVHKMPFERLAFAEQTKLLEQVEANKVPRELWTGVRPGDFFRLVRDHTMQAFYGSPRHGGNKGYASYKMLGIEYPRVIGRNHREG